MPIHHVLTATRQSQQDEVVLRTYDLTKRYGTRTAVHLLNLEIRRGELVGFLGPNGAGKTTSIRMILGLITPSAGRVELFGHDLATARASLLPRIGALVETPALYLDLTGRENLRAVAEIFGRTSHLELDEIQILKVIGLSTRQKDRVRSYSLGMKQRLAVGLALLHHPDLLILDEPANGLDPAGMVEMRDLLRGLTEAGKTVFLSSHLLSEVQQLCSRVMVITNGQLVADSSIEELTQKPGEYVVRLEHAAEALLLLQQQPWSHYARLDGSDQLITSAPQGSGRELYTFLAQAGFIPESLAPATQNLEQVFFALTNPNEGSTNS